MSELAVKLAEQKNELMNQQKQQRDKVLGERDFIKNQVDSTWVGLRTRLQEHIDTYNQVIKSEKRLKFAGAADHNKVSVSSEANGMVIGSLSINPNDFTLAWSFGNEKWKLSVDSKNELYWKSDSYGSRPINGLLDEFFSKCSHAS